MLKDIGVDCGQGYLFAKPQAISVYFAAYEKHNAHMNTKVGT